MPGRARLPEAPHPVCGGGVSASQEDFFFCVSPVGVVWDDDRTMAKPSAGEDDFEAVFRQVWPAADRKSVV